jgi:hypothetical protein
VGTEFAGDYYVGDGTGYLLVYKEKSSPITGDPGRGLTTSVAGAFEFYPEDGGALGQPQMTGQSLTLTIGSPGTLPTSSLTPTLAQVDANTGDTSLLGQYVEVPAGNYTQNSTSPVWTYTSSSTHKTYYDGVVLTSGSNTVMVETTTFQYPTKSCRPDAGPNIDFSKGGFKGVFDTEQTDDGAFHMVVVFGDCSDLP